MIFPWIDFFISFAYVIIGMAKMPERGLSI